MEIDELVEQAKAAQYSHVWVDTNALRSLIRERETLRAEIDELKAQPAPAGHSIREREIVNDRLAALEDTVKGLESLVDSHIGTTMKVFGDRKILDEQRMDRLAALEDAVKDLQYGETRHGSRLDDFIGRIDAIERSHLESAE